MKVPTEIMEEIEAGGQTDAHRLIFSPFQAQTLSSAAAFLSSGPEVMNRPVPLNLSVPRIIRAIF